MANDTLGFHIIENLSRLLSHLSSFGVNIEEFPQPGKSHRETLLSFLQGTQCDSLKVERGTRTQLFATELRCLVKGVPLRFFFFNF